MATPIQLRKNIKDLQKALNAKGVPAALKTKLKEKLEKAEADLNSLKKKRASGATAKSQKPTLDRLQKLVQKAKYSIYKNKGIDLKKDAAQPAFASGKRVSKGLKANQVSGKGNAKANKGNVYYEYRANRVDVKQPPKRYPKLEKGGLMDKVKAVKAKYSGGGMSDRYSTEVGDEQITVSVGGKEKTGYPVYAKVSGYAPKTVGVFPTKEAAEKKAMQLEKKNKLEDGGYMEKGGKTPLGIARNTDYIVALELPYRIDFYKKTDKKGTGLGSIMVNQSDGKWSVKERKYSDTKGGYYDELVQGLTKDDALNFVSKMINKKMANGGYMAGGGETDGKIRFDMYGYVYANDRTQSGDEIIMVSSYKEAEDKAEKFLKEYNYQLVELYRKNDFVGSIRTKKNFVYSTRYKKDDFANGGYMAGGGKTEMQFKVYKLRAEGINDFMNFLGTGIYFNINWFKVEIDKLGLPDVVVSFETELPLSYLKSKLREVADSHVMLDTIKPIKQYTGERYAKGGYMANGGELHKMEGGE